MKMSEIPGALDQIAAKMDQQGLKVGGGAVVWADATGDVMAVLTPAGKQWVGIVGKGEFTLVEDVGADGLDAVGARTWLKGHVERVAAEMREMEACRAACRARAVGAPSFVADGLAAIERKGGV